MKKTLTTFGFLAVFPAGVAMAGDDCTVSMTDWQPRGAVIAMAAQHGWTVRRIKIHDGCYALDGRDADGQRIEITLNPATLEILEIDHRDKHREGHD